MARRKFNAIGSTADIAFLLLCYFLMTTTMGEQSGLQRRLPPIPDANQQQQDQKVNRRNIIIVRINSADKLFAGSEAMDISFLKEKIKEFLTNPTNDPNLPEKEPVEANGKTYMKSKGVISLQNDRGDAQVGRDVFPSAKNYADATDRAYCTSKTASAITTLLPQLVPSQLEWAEKELEKVQGLGCRFISILWTRWRPNWACAC